ncbi:glyoxylase-like metal-dependent hydrolase (beta-lactamase superfamily II) [Arcicella aurantiaca]|uniref:Glyoxylase-like metal-dependent hydrolase (Beta-lactamase superfamily II) n=1 Tax=Arcicella aurantiaca TaxID=591202 RepID=A0A316DIB5_9BACT|nr:MBL fold metallo-hydrolase [Arcicella aurantiaca]PWK17615.1 glyoxylase-like metal-dependent hydrolase (beta-lactamase superfamily II) [Arcicella aurantiaca]
MIIQEGGHIGQGIYLLGTTENPIYLMGANHEWTLIEGGLISTTDIVLEQLKNLNISLSDIKHWIITHCHFDHCGLLETIYPKLPSVKVYASAEAIEAFQNPKYLRQIRKYNEFVVPNLALISQINLTEIPFVTIENGQYVSLGEEVLEVIKTAGHSPCSLSFWNQKKGVLFVSDALGELRNNYEFFPLAFQSLEIFRQSIKRLAQYDAQIVALGHNGVLTQNFAKNACTQALDGLEAFYNQAENLHKQGLSLEQAAQHLSGILYPHSANFVPKELHYFSMVRLLNNLTYEAIY